MIHPQITQISQIEFFLICVICVICGLTIAGNVEVLVEIRPVIYGNRLRYSSEVMNAFTISAFTKSPLNWFSLFNQN
jgi:hypothetical protein